MKLFLSRLVASCRELYPTLNPMQKLVELTQTPVLIKIFKFGKYKGESIEEVARKDANYLNWMRENMKDLDEDMRFSIDYYLKD